MTGRGFLRFYVSMACEGECTHVPICFLRGLLVKGERKGRGSLASAAREPGWSDQHAAIDVSCSQLPRRRKESDA